MVNILPLVKSPTNLQKNIQVTSTLPRTSLKRPHIYANISAGFESIKSQPRPLYIIKQKNLVLLLFFALFRITAMGVKDSIPTKYNFRTFFISILFDINQYLQKSHTCFTTHIKCRFVVIVVKKLFLNFFFFFRFSHNCCVNIRKKEKLKL